MSNLKLWKDDKYKRFWDMTSVSLLALCIYCEARGEGLEGQRAVAGVIINRLKGKPDLYQGTVKNVILHCYQFSWLNPDDAEFPMACNLADRLKDGVAPHSNYNDCLAIAREFLAGRQTCDAIKDATLYYNPKVATKPNWDFSKLELVAHIGNHVFYRERE
ncbi:MAG: cell wall hydrolase [Nitrospirae bacterium]|nr:cell wall hydrolase [Nitrospirota bacterium]